MSTIRWIPSTDETSTRDLGIPTVIIAAYEPINATSAGPTNEDTPRTNHWSTFLVTGPNSSVRLDPTPTGPNNEMILIVNEENTMCTANAHKTVILKLKKKLTVEEFFKLLKANGYEKYNFNQAGTGCRNWTLVIVGMLQQHGYLDDEGQYSEAEEALKQVWLHGKVMSSGHQTGLDKGEFYK